MWGERKIRDHQKPDLRGGKPATDMIFTDIEINQFRYDLFLNRTLSDGVCRMDEERVFSLSYEQLTRFAERRIRECNLDSQGAIYLCESAKAGAVLIFWHELAINGYASMNAIKRQELIDADFQRLRKLIWPEDDR